MKETETANLPSTEEFLAHRIEELRTMEGWSFADLSQRMAEVGCPIERSSLQKIERGKPRRKITVNELVAFSLVFRVEIPALLVSPAYRAEEMFLRDLEDGPRLAAEVYMAQQRMQALVTRVAQACLDGHEGPLRERGLRTAAEDLRQRMGDDVSDSIKYGFLEDVLKLVDEMKEGGKDGRS